MLLVNMYITSINDYELFYKPSYLVLKIIYYNLCCGMMFLSILKQCYFYLSRQAVHKSYQRSLKCMLQLLPRYLVSV